MNLTWNELAQYIRQDMTPEQRETNVTIFVQGIDEYYPVGSFAVADEENGVLDDGHPFLKIANEE